MTHNFKIRIAKASAILFVVIGIAVFAVNFASNRKTGPGESLGPADTGIIYDGAIFNYVHGNIVSRAVTGGTSIVIASSTVNSCLSGSMVDLSFADGKVYYLAYETSAANASSAISALPGVQGKPQSNSAVANDSSSSISTPISRVIGGVQLTFAPSPTSVYCCDLHGGGLKKLATINSSRVVLSGSMAYWIKQKLALSIPASATGRSGRPLSRRYELWATSLTTNETSMVSARIYASTRLIPTSTGVCWTEPLELHPKDAGFTLSYCDNTDIKEHVYKNNPNPLIGRGVLRKGDRLYWLCGSPANQYGVSDKPAELRISRLDGSVPISITNITGPSDDGLVWMTEPSWGPVAYDGRLFCACVRRFARSGQMANTLLCEIEASTPPRLTPIMELPVSSNIVSIDGGYVYFTNSVHKYETAIGAMTRNASDGKSIKVLFRMRLAQR